jgi:hypothetical protein
MKIRLFACVVWIASRSRPHQSPDTPSEAGIFPETFEQGVYWAAVCEY